jgi:hypothetical protein
LTGSKGQQQGLKGQQKGTAGKTKEKARKTKGDEGFTHFADTFEQNKDNEYQFFIDNNNEEVIISVLNLSLRLLPLPLHILLKGVVPRLERSSVRAAAGTI